MIDQESVLNLEADVGAVHEFLAAHGGEVVQLSSEEGQPGVYWLRLKPRSAPVEEYIARIVWRRYPQEAPSVQFAESVGGNLRLTRAWPIIAGYRAGSFDICKPFTSEGFALHAEWRTGTFAWPETGNPFLFVATQLQDDLDRHYQGRSG